MVSEDKGYMDALSGHNGFDSLHVDYGALNKAEDDIFVKHHDRWC